MPITGTIKMLFSNKEKTDALFPCTKLAAVSDDNNIGLNVLLDAKADKAYVEDALSTVATPDVSGQINEHNAANDAHSARFNALDTKFNELDTEVDGLATEVSGLNTKINTNSTSISNINTTINTLNSSMLSTVFVAGTNAPSNTRLLWIDTTASTGGLKYHNGSTWVHVPVSYT